MARIPQEELERLKREVDLVDLITMSGVQLEKKGGNLVGLCPMHDDKDPSLVVTPSKNLWNCLGACGAGGTVIDWVMKSQAGSGKIPQIYSLTRGKCLTNGRATKRSNTASTGMSLTRPASRIVCGSADLAGG